MQLVISVDYLPPPHNYLLLLMHLSSISHDATLGLHKAAATYPHAYKLAFNHSCLDASMKIGMDTYIYMRTLHTQSMCNLTWFLLSVFIKHLASCESSMNYFKMNKTRAKFQLLNSSLFMGVVQKQRRIPARIQLTDKLYLTVKCVLVCVYWGVGVA